MMTPKVPIVTGLIKVKAQNDIPVFLKINEAPFNSDSPVTLLSEYQVREFGYIIDSVATKHEISPGTYGTQRFILNDVIYLPFEDRGGMMGFEILPITDDDFLSNGDPAYDVFEITSPTQWLPQRFRQNGPRTVYTTLHNNRTEDTQDDNDPNGAPTERQLDGPKTQTNTNIQDTLDKRETLTETTESDTTKDDGLPGTANVPYYFDPEDNPSLTSKVDPTDDIISTYESPTLVCNWEVQNSTSTEAFINHLTYEELTGVDRTNFEYYGYPPIEEYDPLLHESDDRISHLMFTPSTLAYAVKSWHRVLHQELDPRKLQPFLAWRPLEVIKETLKCTTQLARMCIRYPLRKHLKARNPHLNVKRLDEAVSTDPIFANCKSLYHGYIGAQVYYGLRSRHMDVYGLKSESDFPDTLRDFIREQGAPSILRRDNARTESSAKVKAITREMFIKDQFSEPYNQQQNKVEGGAIKWLKNATHTLLDRTGAPDIAWYFCLMYLAMIHNICWCAAIKTTPYQRRHGMTADISAFLQFCFWERVLYLDHEESWPRSHERPGY
jgi:hypothetical protein